jgi:hypothetical protein
MIAILKLMILASMRLRCRIWTAGRRIGRGLASDDEKGQKSGLFSSPPLHEPGGVLSLGADYA